MAIPASDIALFLISAAACVYCMVLSRRLKALHDTKDGLGATIMAFSKAMADMSSSTQETRARAGALASQLSSLMSGAEQTCTRVETLAASLEQSQSAARDEITAAQAELSEMMRTVLQQSREHIVEVTHLIEQMKQYATSSAAAHTYAPSIDTTTAAPKRVTTYHDLFDS